MSRDDLDYAVIGTGYWGSNHARVGAELLSEGEIESLTLCDIDEDRVADLADSYGVSYVTDPAALPAAGVDVATVATPSPTHHEIASGLLEHGVDLLVEKPLTLESATAWDLVEQAEAADRTLAVGHIFRCHPALEELKRRIGRGELGRIKYLNSTRFSFRAPRATAGALYSLAVHDVDISNWLLDATPESGFCRLDSVLRDDVDETATVVLDYDDATSVINESWQVPVYGKRRDLTVVGSEATAFVNYLEDTTLEIYDSRVVRRDGQFRTYDEGVQRYELDAAEPLRVEVERFLDACRGTGDPAAPGRIGAETIELLEQLEKSSADETVVDL